MKEFFRNLKDFAQRSKLNAIVFGVLSTVLIALPFIALIFVFVFTLPRTDSDLPIILASLFTFIGFIVSYIFFTKFMNKV